MLLVMLFGFGCLKGYQSNPLVIESAVIPCGSGNLQLFLLAACKGEVAARILAVDACFSASGLFWLSRHWNRCNEFNFSDSFCLVEFIIKRTCLMQRPVAGMPLRLAFATHHCQLVVVLAVPVMSCSQLLRKQQLALIECHSLGCFLRLLGLVADIWWPLNTLICFAVFFPSLWTLEWPWKSDLIPKQGILFFPCRYVYLVRMGLLQQSSACFLLRAMFAITRLLARCPSRFSILQQVYLIT